MLTNLVFCTFPTLKTEETIRIARVGVLCMHVLCKMLLVCKTFLSLIPLCSGDSVAVLRQQRSHRSDDDTTTKATRDCYRN